MAELYGICIKMFLMCKSKMAARLWIMLVANTDLNIGKISYKPLIPKDNFF